MSAQLNYLYNIPTSFLAFVQIYMSDQVELEVTSTLTRISSDPLAPELLHSSTGPLGGRSGCLFLDMIRCLHLKSDDKCLCSCGLHQYRKLA